MCCPERYLWMLSWGMEEWRTGRLKWQWPGQGPFLQTQCSPTEYTVKVCVSNCNHWSSAVSVTATCSLLNVRTVLLINKRCSTLVKVTGKLCCFPWRVALPLYSAGTGLSAKQSVLLFPLLQHFMDYNAQYCFHLITRFHGL